MMRTLRLYGPMGAQFGRVHRFDLSSGTPLEAMAALASQVRGVREYLTRAKERGLEFAVFVGKRNLPKDHLGLPASDDIRVAPILKGSKRAGVLNTIVGIVLVVVDSVWLHTGYLSNVGYGMIAGGVMQLLTPTPRGINNKEGAGSTPNYNFSGPVNTQAQGNPVAYFAGGPLTIGSSVISAGIDTIDTYHYTVGGFGGFMGGGGSDGTGGHIARFRIGE